MLDTVDEAALDVLGLYTIQDVAGVACESIWWAVYLTLFCVAAYIQVKKRIGTLGGLLMLVTTILLFSSSTALWAMKLAVMIIRQQERMLGNKHMELSDRIAQSNQIVSRFGAPMEALFLLNMLVGDSVVIWRAWVLWTGDRKRKLLIVPVVMLILALAFAIIDVQCIVSNSFGTKSTIPSGSRLCQWAEPIAWAISLVTNAAATGFIATKAWQHRRFFKKGMGYSTRRSPGEKILILLVESGFVYCIFWLLQIVNFLDIPRTSGNIYYFYIFFSTMGEQISGLYPTMIIILVKLQQSIYDHTTVASNFRPSETPTVLRFEDSQSVPNKSHPHLTVDTLALEPRCVDRASAASRSQCDKTWPTEV